MKSSGCNHLGTSFNNVGGLHTEYTRSRRASFGFGIVVEGKRMLNESSSFWHCGGRMIASVRYFSRRSLSPVRPSLSCVCVCAGVDIYTFCKVLTYRGRYPIKRLLFIASHPLTSRAAAQHLNPHVEFLPISLPILSGFLPPFSPTPPDHLSALSLL